MNLECDAYNFLLHPHSSIAMLQKAVSRANPAKLKSISQWSCSKIFYWEVSPKILERYIGPCLFQCAFQFRSSLFTEKQGLFCKIITPLRLPSVLSSSIFQTSGTITCPNHTKLCIWCQPRNCWGLCWETNADPPLFTLLQSEMPMDGVWTG